MENNQNEHIDEVLKNSPLVNPEITFCEQTTYLDFLLSNAETETEKEQIKETVNSFLEITDEIDEKVKEETN